MEWIKTSEQLPDKDATYWVYTPYYGVSAAYFQGETIKDYKLEESPSMFYWEVNEMLSHEFKDVTHWMPYYTPEPPKK